MRKTPNMLRPCRPQSGSREAHKQLGSTPLLQALKEARSEMRLTARVPVSGAASFSKNARTQQRPQSTKDWLPHLELLRRKRPEETAPSTLRKEKRTQHLPPDTR
eukprot:Amastigsp_a843054_36.p3 type:complete len:105 gc:universal Amastigsp_a843054_36:458-144(-)